MKELLLIPVFKLTAYLLYVYFRYGMTPSISASYKLLQGWEKPLFTITLWFVALPVMVVGIDSVPDNWPEILFFLAGAGICLVGASPEYWSGKMEKTAHYIGSYGGIAFGMVGSLVYFFSLQLVALVLLFAVFSGLMFFYKKVRVNNFIYWVEVVALAVVLIILAIQ